MTTPSHKSAARILQSTPLRPALAIVLGSGFHALQQSVRAPVEIPYRALPGFLQPKVDGHRGKLIAGHIEGVPVFVLCGRCHYYEGYSLARITFPIRVLAACGVQALLLTNAAGGINPKFRTGDFMALTDHLNFMGGNPLRGWRGRPSAFLDLSETYDPYLQKVLASAARRARARLHAGVYVAVSGPCYETPAEIRAFARLGGDAIGMSTVPEAVVARHCGLRVAALSCISNPAAGLAPGPISHEEVLAAGAQVQTRAAALLGHFVGELAGHNWAG